MSLIYLFAWQESALRGVTYSTHCSGVGTVERVLSWICAVAPFAGISRPKFSAASASALALAEKAGATVARPIAAWGHGPWD